MDTMENYNLPASLGFLYYLENLLLNIHLSIISRVPISLVSDHVVPTLFSLHICHHVVRSMSDKVEWCYHVDQTFIFI